MKFIIQSFTVSVRVLALMGLSILAVGASAVTPAPSLTDQLLGTLLDKHTPTPLYEQANNAWPGGSFTLQIFQHGKPRITSGASSIHLQVPLKVEIAGNAANEFLRIKLNCSTSFTTLGEVELTPTTPDKVNVLKSEITLPIPAAVANCDGVNMPIDSYLTALVKQYKGQWESQIDEEVNARLAE